MDRDQAIASLPLPYAVALRLHDAAADPEIIAHALGIDPAGVPGVLALGEAKLEAVLASRPDTARECPHRPDR